MTTQEDREAAAALQCVTDADREAYARMEGYERGDINWRLIMECRPDCAGVVAFTAHRIAAEQRIVAWLRDHAAILNKTPFPSRETLLKAKGVIEAIEAIEAGEHLAN